MFAIPTLQDLSDRARKAFRANLPGSDAWIWPNNLYATVKVFAGLVYEIFGFADYIQRQKFAGTADGEHLDLHGQEFGLARRPPQPASGKVTLTSTGDLIVALGAIFERTDGIQYIAQLGASRIGAGTLDVVVKAAADGKSTNTEAGAPLEIVSGVTGDATAAIVAASGLVDGKDVEPDGEYWTSDLGTFRGRILFRKRNPPHGGAPADYVRWATEVSGVTRVFVERHWSGAGTIRVFPLMDDIYANGIAAAADIERIAAHIDELAPAGSIVTVAAPTAVPVNVNVSGLSPDTSETREAVINELRDAFRRLSRVSGSDIERSGMPYLAHAASFSVSWIWQAVAGASGEERHRIVLPAEDIVLGQGQLPTLGTVTFS